MKITRKFKNRTLKKKKKKGQISIFIIIGLIILFTVIILIYTANMKLAFQPSKVVPQDVEPIRNLIEQCMEDKARPLINHMMFHSGYADLTLSFNYFPVLQTPYSLPEDRNEMEGSLKKKIESSIKDCIDFTGFKQFNIEEKQLSLAVNINDEDVALSMEYPLEITNIKTNEKTKLLDFKKNIPTKLGKLSDLARMIMNQENTQTFLEEMTLDILRSNSPVTFPYEGMELTTENRRWSINNDLKPAMKEMLMANLDCITYQGTSSDNLLDSCLEGDVDPSSYYQKFSIPVTADLKYKDTKVIISNTFTPDWDFIEFSVAPSKGDSVNPINPLAKTYNPVASIIGKAFKLYHHRYNIKYPVLFKLVEEEETFYFATTSNINNNIADRKAIMFFTSPSVNSDDFCNEKENEYTVIAEDNGKALEGVDIKFKCAQFECEIGKTMPELMPGSAIPVYGSEPKLKEKFPFCYNGVLIANKQNYLESVKVVSDASPVITIEMTPTISLDCDFNVIDSFPRKLEEGESVLVMLSNEENSYDQQIYYPSETEIELLLGDYTYDVEIYLTKDEKLIGGYKKKINIMTREGDKKITFEILADSGIETDEQSVAFFVDIEEKSKNYAPRVTW